MIVYYLRLVKVVYYDGILLQDVFSSGIEIFSYFFSFASFLCYHQFFSNAPVTYTAPLKSLFHTIKHPVIYWLHSFSGGFCHGSSFPLLCLNQFSFRPAVQLWPQIFLCLSPVSWICLFFQVYSFILLEHIFQ